MASGLLKICRFKQMSDPIPIGVPLTDLRPTQMTVGFREVEIKRRQWREADEQARAKLLRRRVVPAVVGPKGTVLYC